uniref:Amidohydrolase-related domain-containing protein n=1 Tax=Timema monikensis TaxID=170555 RepID=A0A7R9E101_9NEOP|nr:unnamed protein product [Timema monikensis]
MVLTYFEGQIVAVENTSLLSKIQLQYSIPDSAVTLLADGEFLCPGLVDCHIHAPQYVNLGLGLDKALLEWLDTYTFPLEEKYKDIDFATKVYNAVVNKTLNYGTTTACYFSTIHLESSLKLASIVKELGQRALVGKVNMNQNSPESLTETTTASVQDTESFIKSVLDLQSDLVQPIVTPRFAISCDMDLMKQLGALAEKYKTAIQLHLDTLATSRPLATKENAIRSNTAYLNAEVSLELPSCAICNMFSQTLLAHGIYLEDSELKILVSKGATIAHCPNSNTSLKSGECDVPRLLAAGISVGLGTDVSGGYSPSIIEAMRSALAVSTHLNFKEGGTPLTYHEVFHLATIGGAKALSLDNRIGNFVVGKEFDALIVNMNSFQKIPDELSNYTNEELLQKFIFTGDDRNIRRVYVAGNVVKDATLA